MSELFNLSLDMLVTGRDSNIKKVIVEKNPPQAHMNGWEFVAKYWVAILLFCIFVIVPLFTLILVFVVGCIRHDF